MKKLLLAFALIGFVATASYASDSPVKFSSEIEFCDDHKDCNKKDCKHDKKATASKKECTKGKKSCCASKATASKKGAKSCHGSKSADTKTASVTKPVKKENKEKK